jgi:uncharacterized delta-60 repeat protein
VIYKLIRWPLIEYDRAKPGNAADIPRRRNGMDKRMRGQALKSGRLRSHRSVAASALFAAYCLFLCRPAMATGQPDLVVRTGFGGANDSGNAVVLQTDGKIVMAGGAGDHFAVVRYNNDGSLDTGFGGTGKVITHFGARKSTATAVRIQNDGKIVAAGYSSSGFDTAFAVARYNPDGSLDATFDGDGRVTTQVRGISDRAFALAIQSDGKIVVGGEAATFAGDYDFALVRYNPDGSLDSTFDGDGRVISVIGSGEDTINAITLYLDKIIVAGVAQVGTNNAFAVASYKMADGSLDTTFNTSGMVFPAIGDQDGAFAVAIQIGNGSVAQPDKLVVAGHAHVGGSTVFAVVRFLLNGSLDTTFDGDGKATAAVTGADFGRGLIVQGGGFVPRKIVVGGSSFDGVVGKFSAVRFNSDGSLDSGFHGDGKFITALGSKNDVARGVVMQGDGKYVLAGSSSNGVDDDFGLLRCDSTGTMLDNNFDGDGKRTDDVGDIVAPARSIVVQPDKKILVAGSGNNRLLLARYYADGLLDASFGSGGRSSIPLGLFSESGHSAVLQPDGKIAVTGYVSDNGIVKAAVIRCLPNGSLDPSFDGDGRAVLAVGQSGVGTAVAVQSDGKIVLAGYSQSPSPSAFVARFDANGVPDPTFDGDGLVIPPLANGAQATAMVLQPDGKIVVAGIAAQDFFVLRYNNDGSPDNSFDDDGVATVSLSTGYDQANAVAIQPDGKIVAAGTSLDTAHNQYRFAIARFSVNGAPDVALAGSGKVATPVGTVYSSANAVAIQPDGRILVAGTSDSGVDAALDMAVVRYNSDGSIDGSYGDAGKVILDLSNGNDLANGAALDDRGRLVLAGDSGGIFGLVRLTTDFVPPTLANISTRLRVETGDNILIGGFIVTGTEPKKVMIRAIGPSLPFAGRLDNPTLELYQGSTLLALNDDWQNQPAQDRQAVLDTTIPPTNDLEAAIVRTLPANGTAYTAIVRGVNDGTGIGVVEAYDLDRTVDSKLANISTRGLVQTGDNVLIAGTIVVGSSAQTVIVRAIGPSLPIEGKLENPTLELRDGNGGLLEENDDWINSPNKQAIADSGIAPSNDAESAIVRTLPPAAYTTIVRGVNDTTGIAVVEVYALN